ncbi:PD-(D/E)XK nuclease family transposase [Desulfoscipio sp. XC116]|uniref:PD-(D/E)XK nuclease family transposase n=1 Tax=Desulfoscipio sp. XC116 TaxID=3144975 RepID=UPI00325AD891
MTAEQTGNLLSPLNDLVFKALFAREEPRSRIILIDLLNSLLGLCGDEKIISITHLNPFNYKEYPDDKSSILDIKDTSGRNEPAGILADLYEKRP